MKNIFLYIFCITTKLLLSAHANEFPEVTSSLSNLNPSAGALKNKVIDEGEKFIEHKLIDILKKQELEKREESKKDKQLVLFSSAKSIQPVSLVDSSNKANQLVYLGKKVKIPANWERVDPYNQQHRDHHKYLREEMYQRMEKMGIQSIAGGDVQDENVSALFYSTKYNICFFTTENILDFSIYSGEHLTQKAECDHEQKIVNEFIEDLNTTIGNRSTEILNIQECSPYFSKEKIRKLGGTATPLKCLLNIYANNKDLFEGISADLEEYEEKYEVNGISVEVFEEESRKIYNRLIEKKVFKDILNVEYEDELNAHVDIYNLILGWEDLCRSFSVTCALGACGNPEYGKEFYSAFILPFLDSLLMNPNNYYFNLSSFFTKDFGIEFALKRFHVIKFKAEGVNKIPAIALCGFKLNPQATIKPVVVKKMATTKPVVVKKVEPTKPLVVMKEEKKNNCVMM
ncbi:hypothetical protein [Candidatus Paracaedibacter symbiosus]|uniref:hypothetical protein n=1 Tax=Candidatus Paracaedibacter symbiosus TaxID=244582 RepID=UPI000509C9CC|nr:hypothetical protein [Candidatus Paracaedibacter symbiosus]